MLYGDWVGRWGRSFPEKGALVDVIENRRYTYGQLAEDVNRMANYLQSELHLGTGDRVACLSFNRVEYIKLFLALSRLGAILVPLNFRLAPAEFIYFLEDATPKAIFFDQAHQDRVEGFKKRVDMVTHYVCFDDDGTVGQPLPNRWPSLSTDCPVEVEIEPDAPQLIIYTSGTTGLPKGVILTHGMLTWNAINTNLGWDLRSDDRTILHAAMFYTAGWNVFTLPLFYCRGTNILIQSFDADLILDLIGSEGVTVFFGVPTMFQMLIDSARFSATDFSTVRFMVSGGAPLPKEIQAIFQKEKSIRIWEGYGLTEAGPNNFLANGKLGTVGHSMPHVDVKIVDKNGDEVPAGEEGEILLRGPHLCAGYWNKPEASAEAFSEDWFKTGDFGRVDEDGHFSIVGRLKDMIISGGANIYPAEIERAVETHPAVAGVAVIGVPDPKWGEVGKAIVELHSGNTLSSEELQVYLRERLGKFKIPKYMVAVDELPRTAASGKVQKFMLKKDHGQADNE
jgi:fatty-acyl-CoA synthase